MSWGPCCTPAAARVSVEHTHPFFPPNQKIQGFISHCRAMHTGSGACLRMFGSRTRQGSLPPTPGKVLNLGFSLQDPAPNKTQRSQHKISCRNKPQSNHWYGSRQLRAVRILVTARWRRPEDEEPGQHPRKHGRSILLGPAHASPLSAAMKKLCPVLHGLGLLEMGI